MTVEILKGFGNAWLDKNVDDVMRYFTEDCRYLPSVSSEQHQVFSGKEEVKKAIVMMMDLDNVLESKVGNIFIKDGFGFWEWEYTSNSGERVQGCDVFQFQGNLIRSKNAYRKVVRKDSTKR